MARPWRALLPVLLAIAVVHFFLIASYRVSSPSMVPTLLGGPEGGDRLLAWRPAFRSRLPRRFELIVFERPGEGRPVVKRVVGLGGERIHIDRGEIRTSRGDEPPRLLRKSLEEFREVAVPVAELRGLPPVGGTWDYDPARWTPVEQELRLREERGSLRFLRLVRAPSSTGEAEGEPVGDLLLRIEVARLPAGGTLGATIAEDGERFGVRASTDGKSPTAFLWNDEVRGGADRSLPADRPFVLEFFNVDDRFGLAVDGELWASIDTEPTSSPEPSALGSNGLFVEVEGEGAVLRELALSRDLYYTARGTYGTTRPHPIPPDHVFVLGDNSEVSEDSREWGEIPLSALRGKPFLIFFPFSRCRWL